MADYYYFVDIEKQQIQSLGKKSEAKRYLPFLAYKYQNKPVCIYGDETHCFIEEKYVYDLKFNEVDTILNDIDITKLKDIEISVEEFYGIIEKIGGKEINNLNDYIRYKYKNQ